MNMKEENYQNQNAPTLKVTDLTVGYSMGGAMENRQGIKSLLGVNRKIFPVINQISFSIQFKRKIVAILGPNGAGKTTLLRAVSGTIPSSGFINWDGLRINQVLPDELARIGITYVPHYGGIFNNLTIQDHLKLASNGLRHEVVIDKLYGRLRDKESSLIETIAFLKKSGKAGNLSGGEQKILSLIRLLFKKWSLILIDEPTAGLSPKLLDTYSVILDMLYPASILTVEQYSRAETAKHFGAELYELHGDGLRLWIGEK